jgi:hypothetical protein
MYPGLVWDTCKIHAKYQDTCILLECNRAFKIHLRYIRIHERYMYPSGYMQDTSQYIRIRILITNPPKLDNKPPLTLVAESCTPLVRNNRARASWVHGGIDASEIVQQVLDGYTFDRVRTQRLLGSKQLSVRCRGVRWLAAMCASRGSGVVWPRGSGVVWRVSVSGSPRWSGWLLRRVRRGRPPSRPRGAVGSGAAAVESAADSVVSRSLGCGGGLGWL